MGSVHFTSDQRRTACGLTIRDNTDVTDLLFDMEKYAARCGRCWRVLQSREGLVLDESGNRDDIENRIDAMANDGRLSRLAMQMAIDEGVDWPSLDGEEQDSWCERAIEAVRAEAMA